MMLSRLSFLHILLSSLLYWFFVFNVPRSFFWLLPLLFSNTFHLLFKLFSSLLHQDTDFLGREALMQQRQDGVTRRFIMLVLEDHDTELDLWPWWGEPIYRNGHLAGTTTSSAYSYSLERHVSLGFVSPPPGTDGLPTPITPDFINRGDYEVDIAGQRYPAKAKLYPFSSLFTQQKRRKEDLELSNLQGKWCRVIENLLSAFVGAYDTWSVHPIHSCTHIAVPSYLYFTLALKERAVCTNTPLIMNLQIGSPLF